MATESTPKKTCFIAMPVTTPEQVLALYDGDADHFRHVLDCLFMPAILAAGLEPISPVSTGSEVIHADIIQQLQTADLVLVDMSSLNSNAFFEFGIRVAVNKPVCVVRDNYTPAIPFDAAPLNAAMYDARLDGWILPGEISKLSDHITAAFTKSNGRNSLWRHFGLRVNAELPTDAGTPDEKFALILNEMSGIGRALQQLKGGAASPNFETDITNDRELAEAGEWLQTHVLGGRLKRFSLRNGELSAVFPYGLPKEQRKKVKSDFLSRFPETQITWLTALPRLIK